MASPSRIMPHCLTLTFILVSMIISGPMSSCLGNPTTDELLADAVKKGDIEITDDGRILLESDMQVTLEQYKAIRGLGSKRSSQNPIKLWSSTVIPFQIKHEEYVGDEINVKMAFTEIERYTCIRFRPRTSADYNYLYMVNGTSGCNAPLGFKDTGKHYVNINSIGGCRDHGLIVHELLHTIGFIHEHAQWNRDDYVTIFLDKVKPRLKHNFVKWPKGFYPRFDVPYNYLSIMHYDDKAFSIDENLTMVPKNKTYEDYMGKTWLHGISYYDVKLANLMYKCANKNKRKCPNPWKCSRGEGHLDQNCNCICEDGSQDCDVTKLANLANNDKSCNNTSKYEFDCMRRAAKGECFTHYPSTEHTCAKACGYCSGSTSDNSVPSGPCQDVYNTETCQRWKDRGDCFISPAWMEVNCRLTCGFCKGRNPKGNCKDKPIMQCKEAAAHGACTQHKRMFEEHCPETCNVCPK